MSDPLSIGESIQEATNRQLSRGCGCVLILIVLIAIFLTMIVI